MHYLTMLTVVWTLGTCVVEKG